MEDKIEHTMSDEDYMNMTAKRLLRDLADNPGAAIEVDPEVAEHMGAFSETALTPKEAEEASFDEEVENG